MIRARLYEYVLLSLALIAPIMLISNAGFLERLFGPFFLVAVFFTIFLYAPIVIALQFAMIKMKVEGALPLSASAVVVYIADAGWIVGTWSNPLPGGNLKWGALALGAVAIFAGNMLTFKRGKP